MKVCVGAGLSIVASDEVGRPCTHGVQLKCRGATGVKLITTQAAAAAAQVPSWSLAGARAPERVGTDPTLLEFEVSYKGVPVPELTFALKVCAKPLPAAKYGLQVAGGGVAMPMALTLRVTRQDAFGNVLVSDMSDAELPVVWLEAEGKDGEVYLGTGGAAPAVAGGKAHLKLPLRNLGTGLTCVSLKSCVRACASFTGLCNVRSRRVGAPFSTQLTPQHCQEHLSRSITALNCCRAESGVYTLTGITLATSSSDRVSITVRAPHDGGLQASATCSVQVLPGTDTRAHRLQPTWLDEDAIC